ncbi:MAG TPA: DUF1707 domain-containing protein [Streptosporangiaceae bacterium]|nr:DUF1707 domain-containing protein [Streptosporangiaceae bacterium]
MTLSPSADDHASLRASDQDRDRTAEVLREAAAEGRLSLTELDERLDAVYAAKTYAELEPVIRDLPKTGTGPAQVPAEWAGAADRFGGQATSSSAIAVMGGFSRKGEWVVPKEFTAVTFMGGGEIDMRQARFAEREVTIHAVAIMGGISIIVPPDAEVVVTGIGFMGAFDHRAAGAGQPDGPTIRVNGLALMGAVDVRRKPARSLRDLRPDQDRELEPGGR